MLFKKHLATKVLDGTKTQTRRCTKKKYRVGSIQPVKTSYYEKTQGHIQINRRFEQRLSDMTEEEARAEGFNSIAEFKQAWKAINGSWNPDQTVTAYEFTLKTPNRTVIHKTFNQQSTNNKTGSVGK